MEDYLKLLKRRLGRAEKQVEIYKAMLKGLSSEGFRSYGYCQGRVSALEDAIDEIQAFLEKPATQ